MLNEAECLGETLASVIGMPGVCEVIVVDGQSDDATVQIARGSGAKVVLSPRGRGQQLCAGALAASGAILWFLHADTIPPEGAAARIQDTLGNPEIIGWTFTTHFSGNSIGARCFSALYPAARRLGISYGDGSLFVRRDDYHRLGGFPSLPLFEDLEFIRKLRGAGRFRILPECVMTSSRRFEGRALPVLVQWTVFHLLFWAGVPAAVLARAYHPPRSVPPGPNR